MLIRFVFVMLLAGNTAVAHERPSLVFRDAPLERVCRALEERFEVKISVQPTLKNRRITADFSSEGLTTILEDIAFVLTVRYEQRPDIIIIKT
jgi:ferric-dicitrate binding protein FerR (iron transport regulator)